VPEADYLTPAGLALRLGKTKKTICRWCRLGRLPDVVCTRSGRWLIPQGTLADCLSGLLPLPAEGSRIYCGSRPT
jgi:hypothetical protein